MVSKGCIWTYLRIPWDPGISRYLQGTILGILGGRWDPSIKGPTRGSGPSVGPLWSPPSAAPPRTHGHAEVSRYTRGGPLGPSTVSGRGPFCPSSRYNGCMHPTWCYIPSLSPKGPIVPCGIMWDVPTSMIVGVVTWWHHRDGSTDPWTRSTT